MVFSDKLYNVLKWIAQICLPALATFYFGLASIWGLPYAEQVVGTIVSVDTLLGILLGISTANYKGDGTLTLSMDNNGEEADAVIELPSLDTILDKKTIMLEVKADVNSNLD